MLYNYRVIAFIKIRPAEKVATGRYEFQRIYFKRLEHLKKETIFTNGKSSPGLQF